MTQDGKIKQVMNNIGDRLSLGFLYVIEYINLYENYTWYLSMSTQNYNVLHKINLGAYKEFHEQMQSFKSPPLSSFFLHICNQGTLAGFSRLFDS